MSIREECGVFGVLSEKPMDVAGISYYGLYALQHRGQESCGIVVGEDGLFSPIRILVWSMKFLQRIFCSSFRKELWRLATYGMVRPEQQTATTASPSR